MTTYLQEEIDLDDKPINTNVKVCYNKTSHPDMLTEKELESVTTVFRSFESGLREATIYPSVSMIQNLLKMTKNDAGLAPCYVYAWSEPYRAGGGGHS